MSLRDCGRHRASTLIVLAWALTGCGGGGGDGNPAAAVPAGPAVPVWTLQRETAAHVGSTQVNVNAILDHIFTDQAVQVAMLVKLGFVIGERYATSYSANDFVTTWSVAKSFYSAAIGVAIDEGWITSLDQKASDFLTEWQGTVRADITIRNMLEMRAGLPGGADVLYETDQTAYSLNRDPLFAPGATFLYSNVTSQLFEPLLLRATGLSAHAYLRQKILAPIGIDTTQIGLWFDPTGVNPMTYCCIDMRPDDFARFGLLYARGGQWDGVQVVSSAYVNESLAPQSDYYGFQWWVFNEILFGGPVPIVISAAVGFDGQHIYVWPDEDVVLVVFTRYEHFQNQGYVFSAANLPITCVGRNSCADSIGPEVPSYNQLQLLNLLSNL